MRASNQCDSNWLGIRIRLDPAWLARIGGDGAFPLWRTEAHGMGKGL